MYLFSFYFLFIFLFALTLNRAYADINIVNNCATPLIKEVRSITCATAGLREAVQKDNLLRRISKISHSSESGKKLAPVSVFRESVKSTIKNTHNKYQKSGKENYTLHITTYPFSVDKNTCQKNKTIDFKRASSDKSAKADYSVVPGKKSRNFQTRADNNGKFILCEDTNMSPKKRLQFYCGANNNTDTWTSCKNNLKQIPTCAKIDKQKAGNSLSAQSACVASLDDVQELSTNLLSNDALAVKFCPEGCSWYTQTVQRVYKKKGTNKYCFDNYLIVHCGPERVGATLLSTTYNLKIKEIKNICSDFGNTCRQLM